MKNKRYHKELLAKTKLFFYYFKIFLGENYELQKHDANKGFTSYAHSFILALQSLTPVKISLLISSD